MKKREETLIDFGAPSSFGAHIFRVEIPDNRTSDIVITEDFGYKGSDDGIPKEEDRVHLNQSTWTAIADTAKREFNVRLKAAKITVGRWHVGENFMDRLLGKELCVLAWAVETAAANEVPQICTRWAALRPEERWWLFTMTVAETGLPEDTGRGWRKALYYALADESKKAGAKKRRRPKESDHFMSPLFAAKEGL
jgi:hypothetical protein